MWRNLLVEFSEIVCNHSIRNCCPIFFRNQNYETVIWEFVTVKLEMFAAINVCIFRIWAYFALFNFAVLARARKYCFALLTKQKNNMLQYTNVEQNRKKNRILIHGHCLGWEFWQMAFAPPQGLRHSDNRKKHCQNIRDPQATHRILTICVCLGGRFPTFHFSICQNPVCCPPPPYWGNILIGALYNR